MKTITVDPDRRVSSGSRFTFVFVDTDISHLTALSLLLYSLGRPSLGAQANDIARRVKAVFAAGGECKAGVITMDDFGHLLALHKYTNTPGLSIAVLSIADRIWCGLTDDSACPITKTWGLVS